MTHVRFGRSHLHLNMTLLDFNWILGRVQNEFQLKTGFQFLTGFERPQRLGENPEKMRNNPT